MIIHNLSMQPRIVWSRERFVHAVQVIVVVYHIPIYTVHSLDFLVIEQCFLGLQAINLDYFNNSCREQ